MAFKLKFVHSTVTNWSSLEVIKNAGKVDRFCDGQSEIIGSLFFKYNFFADCFLHLIALPDLDSSTNRLCISRDL